MVILGIETSCDETAAALVRDGTKVLSSTVASSKEIHQRYGGIIPEQAAREQLKTIIPILKLAMQSPASPATPRLTGLWNGTGQPCNHVTMNNIDAIAVTVGPGLIGSLLVGVETAKTLAWVLNKPIIPVNHLIAHIYANFLNKKKPNYQLLTTNYFPALCLIVSGGHTELVLMKDHGKFTWLGGTRDDAAGECFDKCARLLGLGYPGGPAIEATASKLQIPPASSSRPRLDSPASPRLGRGRTNYKLQIKLPRPMLHQDNLDFSFSGLKTAVFQTIKKQDNKVKEKNNLTGSTRDRVSIRLGKRQLAFEIQEAITDVLVTKTLKAAKKYKVRSILVGGGVAANSRLREKFQKLIHQLTNSPINLFIPNKNLCTDNAAVIASTAYFNYHPIPWSKIKANPGLEIVE